MKAATFGAMPPRLTQGEKHQPRNMDSNKSSVEPSRKSTVHRSIRDNADLRGGVQRSSSTEITTDSNRYYFGHLNDARWLGSRAFGNSPGQRAPMSETQRLSSAISSLLWIR